MHSAEIFLPSRLEILIKVHSESTNEEETETFHTFFLVPISKTLQAIIVTKNYQTVIYLNCGSSLKLTDHSFIRLFSFSVTLGCPQKQMMNMVSKRIILFSFTSLSRIENISIMSRRDQKHNKLQREPPAMIEFIYKSLSRAH